MDIDALRAESLRAQEELERSKLKVIKLLENERKHLDTLRKEVKERTARRNALIHTLLDLGVSAQDAAGYAGMVPSNITAMKKTQ